MADTPLINEIAQKQINVIAEKCSRIRPLVVIDCITFNHEAYLRDALEGFVMQQTNFPFVAIVHEDASTDNTAEILKEYAEKYPDIILPIFELENQYSKKDGSLTSIRNEAKRLAEAKYIALCEGDDYWTDPFKLQKQVDALETHRECTIALHRVEKVDVHRNSLNASFPPEGVPVVDIVTMEFLMEYECKRNNWCFQTSSYLYRSEMNKEFTKLRQTVFNTYPYGDFPLLLTCLYHGNGVFINDSMSCYTVDAGGILSSMSKDKNRRAKNLQGAATGLRKFNVFTKFKYSKQLNIFANRYEINAELASKDFSYKWFHPKYRRNYTDVFVRFYGYKLPWLRKLIKRLKNRS